MLVWALVGTSAVYWALKFGARSQSLPEQTTLAATPELLQADLARLAGNEAATVQAAAAQPAADARLVLVGVVSPPVAPEQAASAPAPGTRAPAVAGGTTNEGLALISVDGKPPRAFAVGAVVDGERVLQRVSPRAAHLGVAGQPAQWVLTLAPPPEPVRGGAPGGAAPTADGGYAPAPALAVAEAAPPAEPPAAASANPP